MITNIRKRDIGIYADYHSTNGLLYGFVTCIGGHWRVDVYGGNKFSIHANTLYELVIRLKRHG